MGAAAAGQKLLDDDDDFAFSVPFAEIPQRLGHFTQPIATVDDRDDPSRLAKLNDGRQVLHAGPDGQETIFLPSARPVNITAAFDAAAGLPGWLMAGLWQFASSVSGGRLIAASTGSPFLVAGRRRFMPPVPFAPETEERRWTARHRSRSRCTAGR
jgi:hypothetical protein